MSYIGNTQNNQNYAPAIDYFSGNGVTTAFTLSRPVASVAQVQAVISNVPQNPGDAFTVLNNTITFTSAPPTGTNNIYVYYTSPNTQIVQPGQGTVTSSSFAAGASEFALGTLMLFQQTAAPTGWTKQTTHDNKALRVVSGTASSGGSVAFTTAFASGLSADATTLTTTQIPSHRHITIVSRDVSPGTGLKTPWTDGTAANGRYGDYTGGGGSHTHSLPSFEVAYVDIIIASKD